MAGTEGQHEETEVREDFREEDKHFSRISLQGRKGIYSTNNSNLDLNPYNIIDYTCEAMCYSKNFLFFQPKQFLLPFKAAIFAASTLLHRIVNKIF